MIASEHALVRDGWPQAFPLDGWQTVVTGDSDRHVGRAACSCRHWTSEPLPTTQARREAWAQHLTDTKEQQ